MQGGVAMKQVIIELISQNRRMLIAAGVVLLLNIGLQIARAYYLTPAVSKAALVEKDFRQRVAVAGRADAQNIYLRGSADLKKLSDRIPAKRQFPRVLGDILDAAASSGVVTGSVSYKPQPVKNEDLLSYSLSMSVTGGYAAIKSFLSDLQKSKELVVIDGLGLTNSDLYEENVSMDLKLTVYLQGKEGQ
jgi:type IV pilus assembly protein PilO